jgi:hypothetical protein
VRRCSRSFVRRPLTASTCPTALSLQANLCEALDAVLSSAGVLSTVTHEDKLEDQLQSALDAPVAAVRRLALTFVRQTVRGHRVLAPALMTEGGSGSEAGSQLVFYTDALLNRLVCRLVDEDIAVAELAASTLFALAGGRGELQPPHQQTLQQHYPVPQMQQDLQQRQLLEERPPYPQIVPSEGQLNALLAEVFALYQSCVSAGHADALARVVHLAVQVASRISDDVFFAVEDSGLLPAIATLIQGDDVLLQMNVLELLPALASRGAGVPFLLRSGIFERLCLWALEGEADPLLGCGALTAVTDVYYHACALNWQRATSVLRPMLSPRIFDVVVAAVGGLGAATAAQQEAPSSASARAPALRSFSSEDSQLAVTAISALSVALRRDPLLVDAMLGLTPPSSAASSSSSAAASNSAAAPSVAQRALREWLECGVSTDPAVRYAALAGLASVLHHAPQALQLQQQAQQSAAASAASTAAANGAASNGSDALSEAQYDRYFALYDSLGRFCGRRDGEVNGSGSTDVLLFSLRQSAAHEARYAAYDVAAALAALPGSRGLRRLYAAPGFGGYLLDHSTEHKREGLEWKYGVVVATVGNGSSAMLGDTYLQQLRKYKERGAYAGPPTEDRVEVATA